MRIDLQLEKLRALPVQCIEIDGGVVVKRGRVEIKIHGEAAAAAVHKVLEAVARDGMSSEDLSALFAASERPTIDALVAHLIRRRILVPLLADAPEPDAAESCADVFYWHFGLTAHEVAERINRQRILIMGVNHISRQLALSLHASHVTSVVIRDEPQLRNLRLFDFDGQLRDGLWPAELSTPEAHTGGMDEIDPERFDCLVATSDFGGSYMMRQWNAFCLLHKRPFLPVVLQDLIGTVGPLVIPDETACYECFKMRESTHAADPQSRRLIEAAACNAQSTVGFLPPIASSLGDVAAMELIKFFGLGPPLLQVGTLIEMNLMAPNITTRKVLKLPRCPVCTPLADRPSLAATHNAWADRNRGGI